MIGTVTELNGQNLVHNSQIATAPGLIPSMSKSGVHGGSDRLKSPDVLLELGCSENIRSVSLPPTQDPLRRGSLPLLSPKCCFQYFWPTHSTHSHLSSQYLNGFPIIQVEVTGFDRICLFYRQCLLVPQSLLLTENINKTNEVNFLRDGIAAQSFSEYLADTDVDGDNASSVPSCCYVWYCRFCTCPKSCTAWSCKPNFLLC